MKRVVILGLDGMDHGLTETMLEEGKLPHLAALRDRGLFPAAGLDGAADLAGRLVHVPDRGEPGQAQHLRLPHARPAHLPREAQLGRDPAAPPRRSAWASTGSPWARPTMRLLRKSQPFWNVLSEHGIFSCILRVPITFPPEKLRGVLLSAMCVPDLRGTQGMFSYYTTRRRDEGEKIGGEVHHVVREGDTVQRRPRSAPQNPLRPDLGDREGSRSSSRSQGPDRAVLKIDGATLRAAQGRVHRLDHASASASRRA